MPYHSDMDALLYLAEEAKKEHSWLEFSQFCGLRARGVRAAAMEQLDRFIRTTDSWSFERQRAFSQWVLSGSRRFNDGRVVLPHPIRERLIVPTLRRWCEISPKEAEPHLWLGVLRSGADPAHHLEGALELDPSCILARQTLIEWILGAVDYNQHELPYAYINDPADDLQALAQASELISGSETEAWGASALREIAEFRARADSWMTRRSDAGNVVPFVRRAADDPSLN
ncbi:hypothetical protein [Bradyrhizobium mercantei]|uniref:hypothetical protein n=1 Tax=Bradyrhizobium mercantei TaxID=1904807 RepID=UPI0009773169|nr:hypothetical protein [Bradyrhizobium mercantei]